MSLQTIIQLQILLCLTPMWSGYLWVNPALEPYSCRTLQVTSLDDYIRAVETREGATVLVIVPNRPPSARTPCPSSGIADPVVSRPQAESSFLPPSAAISLSSVPRAP